MDPERILDGLNDEQRRAAATTRGPVCILAGAGSGKTTTITRRIAYQVATETFAPTAILAVTFTDKAAGELRERLRALGASAVPARTFHSAALAQLSALSGEPVGAILSSKALLLRQIGNTLPKPFRYRPAGDLATEIEWAKNRRVRPETYLSELGAHTPPVPPDVMVRVFREYERRKEALGKVDFEDLLELAIRMYDTNADALERFRARYRAFTVDEYQDVNLLQQTLLERWLGDRDDLCAVGDDYQSIYGFTGASPEHLLGMPARFPDATVVRLEDNYRSTPQILELANRLVPYLVGAEKTLRPTREPGREPSFRVFPTAMEEATFVAATARALADEGVPLEEMAVLYRTNARSDDFEEALAAARVPFQVRSGAFLDRPAARRMLAVLAREAEPGVARIVARHAEREGYTGYVPPGLGDLETTRQEDLARFVNLAREFDADGERTAEEFVADLRARFASDGSGRGVQLLTYHRAKGLEFEVVFLPRLEESELPIRQAKTAGAVAEERRLLYVGLTRAKRVLHLSTGGGKPSRFLGELGLRVEPKRREIERSDPVFEALRAWRLERARADGVPAYVVFHDRTLEEIAASRPASELELAAVVGVGAAKLERYGADVLLLLAGA